MTKGADQILSAFLALATVAVLPCPAGAQVVCLGASNTAGKGLSQQEAYPAQLESMLRARHYDGRVANAGVSGETTWGMLNRLERPCRQALELSSCSPAAMMSGVE